MTFPAAKRLYEQGIANGSPGDRACAAVGLARLLAAEDAAATATASQASWEQKLQKGWAAWVKKHLTPLKDASLAAIGLLLLLLALARLLSGTLVRHRLTTSYSPHGVERGGSPPNTPEVPATREYAARRELARRVWWAFGLLLVLCAATSPMIATRVEVRDSWWWPVGLSLAAYLAVCVLSAWRDREGDRAPLAIGCAGAIAAMASAPTFGFDPLRRRARPGVRQSTV